MAARLGVLPCFAALSPLTRWSNNGEMPHSEAGCSHSAWVLLFLGSAPESGAWRESNGVINRNFAG